MKAFQTFSEDNPWVFQADAIASLADRRIDVEHIDDLLFSSLDGCGDPLESKKPAAVLEPNSGSRQLGAALGPTKALTQIWNYLRELEKEMASIRTRERLSGAVILRPQATLILGRSDDWEDSQFEAQRLLNSSLHGVTVMTFDQAAERAVRLNQLKEPKTLPIEPVDEVEYDSFAD